MARDVRVHATGPLFDGRAQVALRDYLNEIEEEVAEEGERLVHKYLHQFLQQPTGRYESKVKARPRGSYYEVTDGGKIVYGPWLAGTGSRNYPKTRFRGYRHWRLAYQDLEQSAGRIAQRIIPRYLRRMN